MKPITKVKAKMIASALDTKEGRKLLFEKGFVPAIKEFKKKYFDKWDVTRQEKWMDVAFGIQWRKMATGKLK